MSDYIKADAQIWTGRISGEELYLHEKVVGVDLDAFKTGSSRKTIGLLGYACDEGVKRNQGRIGAVEGPDAIRKQLAKMPNHLNVETQFLDAGTVTCLDGDMERAQNTLSEKVVKLLESNVFPILLGGGHDMAYGHYKGIKKYFGKNKSIGIINFDAHFDLRESSEGTNSGTPFNQIAQNLKSNGAVFHYLCLGIRKDANDRKLFETAQDQGVSYLNNKMFNMDNTATLGRKLSEFIEKVDHLYITIDLDGFTSAYSPGVSAPSPMGFSPEVVLVALEIILNSKKMISFDIAEMNPTYDLDGRTAKLGASLVHFVIHKLERA